MFFAQETIDRQASEYLYVHGEKTKLAIGKPSSFDNGTILRGLVPEGCQTPCPKAIDAKSVVIRTEERLLAVDTDYYIDPVWGSVGLAKNTDISSDNTVYIDYRYSLRRIDSIVADEDGRKFIVKGQSHLTVPTPAVLENRFRRAANIFVDYHSTGGNDCLILPLRETSDMACTSTTNGRISRFLHKIKTGKSVKIVCWGDSVTEGVDVELENAFPALLYSLLKKRFPQSQIKIEIIAVAGSSSRNWLFPAKYPFHNSTRSKECRFDRVEQSKPDLVIIEFINDCSNQPQVSKLWMEGYNFILNRLKAINAESIFVTPHFTWPDMMNIDSILSSDSRPFTNFIKNFCTQHNVALADISSRWQHLYKEGIPYVTFLKNGINHPDTRGHAIFAEEIMKCFDK